MTPLKELPADRQAVLSLLVKQRRAYEQVAGMLKIEESAVRGRAMDAVSALGGAAPEGLDDADRERIADYLLGQLSESERIETLALLLDTSSGRAWARRVSAELAPIAGGGLPAVPDDLDEPAPEPTDPATGAAADAAAAEAEEPGEPDAEGDAAPASPRALGVLAVAAALIIAAIVVFATSSGGSSPLPTGPIPASAATATTASTTPSSTTGSTSGSTTGAATGTTGSSAVSNEVSLRATAAGGNATGAAAVLTSSGQKELAFTAQKLASPPAGEHYVLWLYNSASQFEALGEIATVSGGKVSPVAVSLPPDASTYTGIVVSLESGSAPTKPGTIILAGTSTTPF